MMIGAMNHPARELVNEIADIAALQFDFIDLTLEPPASASWKIDTALIRDCLKKHRLSIVGHTPFYLPIASPFLEVREAALAELRRCISVFAALGAKWMNIHPDRMAPFHPAHFIIEQNILSLNALMITAQEHGIGLMIENLPHGFNTPRQLAPFFKAIPELGLHLDIGHANLLVEKNSTSALVAEFGDRIRHVHLHDNKGGYADIHLPLGTGTLDFAGSLGYLKKAGYDGTITLEVFSHDRHYLSYSRDVLRKAWQNPGSHEFKPENIDDL